MKKLRSDIVINATPNQIWQMLLKQEDYPLWNPFIKKISGSLEVGENIEITLQTDSKCSIEFKPKILIMEENKEFRWLGHLFIKGLFDGEHYFQLIPIGPNQTRLIHGENFSGILANILLKIIGRGTLKGFKAMNSALKEKVEMSIPEKKES
ncbi:SRPBCC domain-containing protein [Xanthovirga aplysinae]|uniref:SRPBCC domain-containing protein n=1 Tax=Xanthovirga aplysinae TaxID=2529853 RepID=UPI0012BC8010|nr:SRPBCC domain-containing protein [Xanthovirga aplysinae]MTI33581.1 SRPBCC domain-containing protein [Xanthovirga aplysinae]